MAKGQKRSNREIRKPKQTKPDAKADSPFPNRVEISAIASGPRGKGKP